MLIIRRRAGESILIGEDIEIEITEISSNKVKIGVRAPDQVRVLRKEIQVTGSQNAAAAAQGPDLRRIIIRQLCESSTLKIPSDPPIRPLTDTLGIR